MTGMLRRAAARSSLAAIPKRGAMTEGGMIKPIAPNFPKTSEKTMGPHGWCRGSYTFWSLHSPIVGPLYRPPWVVGGIHNPTLDPIKHFNTQHRFHTLTAWEWVKCFFWALMPARPFVLMPLTPFMLILSVGCLEQRREPMEIFMDREKYWENVDDYMYGVYFDHHHFSHQLCHRRAHKWGYAGQDITLEGGHH
ncbi:unnamed protein product [Prorocentrum cordatum]|uniref:Uncharacterized protein n=1 Tax=Prorocentrum cordatum TaxID=2364126 RepID=A0ABN9PG01_9DINO|nr:unnamed protein product [Polarella glacialis]